MPPAGGSVSPTGRKFLQIRAARHTATIHSSLFSIHWSRQGGISRPGKPALLPGIAKELLPAGALRSNVVGTCGSPTNAPSLKCPLRGDQFRPPDESFSKSVPQGTPQLFTLPYSLFSSHSLRPEESHAPAFPPHFPGLPRNCSPQGRSHFLGTVPVPAVCGLGMSADFERKLLPAGAGGFPISWGYDKISAGAVGARFYTNKSGAKENHLCRELWVWPGRPLQNMI